MDKLKRYLLFLYAGVVFVALAYGIFLDISRRIAEKTSLSNAKYHVGELVSVKQGGLSGQIVGIEGRYDGPPIYDLCLKGTTLVLPVKEKELEPLK